MKNIIFKLLAQTKMHRVYRDSQNFRLLSEILLSPENTIDCKRKMSRDMHTLRVHKTEQQNHKGF